MYKGQDPTPRSVDIPAALVDETEDREDEGGDFSGFNERVLIPGLYDLPPVTTVTFVLYLIMRQPPSLHK